MGDYIYGINVEPHTRWPVAWYNPAVLFQSAREMVSSSDMIRNADPRELWKGRFDASDYSKPADEHSAFWFDFVSDTGDGGNATYTVARAALADDLGGANLLPIPASHAASANAPKVGADFKRGHLLFLGGDLCYPGASPQDYQYRFLELFEGARPVGGPDPAKRSAFAIAQNHDWFDSASTFRRYFVNRNNGEFIGVGTPQTRSYFAAKLPHGWWVLGVDFALVHDLDRDQFEAFRRLIGDPVGDEPMPELQIEQGAQVILMYPEPYWTRPLGDDAPQGYPKRYQRLEALLEKKGINIRMRLAGDVHHYARESSAPDDPVRDDMLVTCGSGGAFLHPTHAKELARAKVKDCTPSPNALHEELRHSTRIGTVPADNTQLPRYVAMAPYPTAAASKSLCKGNVLALFKFAWNSLDPRTGALASGIVKGNILFALVLGMIYWAAIYSNSLAFSKAFVHDGFLDSSTVHAQLTWPQMQWMWLRALFFSPLAFGVHLLLLSLCLAIAKDEPGWVEKCVVPLIHFVCHVLAAATIFWMVSQLTCTYPEVGCPSTCWWPVLATRVLAGTLHIVAGAVVGGLLFGVYFWLTSRAGLMWNNAFSPLACEDYKGFLRFKIDQDGTLTGYFFGCDRVPKKWTCAPVHNGTPAGDTRPAWTEADGTDKAQWRLVDTFELKPLAARA